MDRYDFAVEYYQDYPEHISTDWGNPEQGRARYGNSVLFSFLTKGRDFKCSKAKNCGCPAMITFNAGTSVWSGYFNGVIYVAQTKALTEKIKKIPNMPDPFTMQHCSRWGLGLLRSPDKVTVENLEALAKAQRLADKYLKRKV